MRSASRLPWFAISTRCAPPTSFDHGQDTAQAAARTGPTNEACQTTPKLVPPFEHVPPIWQLRIGDHRAFYDVDDAKRVVLVRAVRRKPPQATTEEIP